MSTNQNRSTGLAARIHRAFGVNAFFLAFAIVVLIPALLTGVIVLELKTFGFTPPWQAVIAGFIMLLLLAISYFVAVANSLDERAGKRLGQPPPDIEHQWVSDETVEFISFMFYKETKDSPKVAAERKVWLITRRHKIMLLPIIMWGFLALCMASVVLIAPFVQPDGKAIKLDVGSGTNESKGVYRIPQHLTQVVVTVAVIYLVAYVIIAAFKYVDWSSEYVVIADDYIYLMIVPSAWLPWRTEKNESVPAGSVTFTRFVRTGLARLIRATLGEVDTPSQEDGDFHAISPLPRPDAFRSILQEAIDRAKDNGQDTEGVKALFNELLGEVRRQPVQVQQTPTVVQSPPPTKPRGSKSRRS